MANIESVRLPNGTTYNINDADAVQVADIVDNLTSTATNKPLSANMGRVLNEQSAAVTNVYGSKNHLPVDATTQTVNTVTFDIDDDGVITINGTVATTFNIVLSSGTKIKAGDYVFSMGSQGLNSSLEIINDNPAYDMYTGGTVSINIPNDLDAVMFRLWVNGGDVHNNSKIYPMLRDARITDDTFAPFAKTNKQLTADVSGLSNENLLDNPWFTVNQRGATTITGGGYPADRWTLSAGTSVTFGNNGITLANSTQVSQVLENIPPNGRYTLSIKLSDGTIVSGTAQKVDDVSVVYFVNNGAFALYYYPATTSIVLWSANSVTIRAAKLELGSKSTLAHDVAPNYTAELLKCQRYFYRIMQATATAQIEWVMAWVATRAFGRLKTPVPMRTIPTVTFGGAFALSNGASNNAVTNISITAYTGDTGTLQVESNTLTIGAPYVLNGTTANAYIDFSADL